MKKHIGVCLVLMFGMVFAYCATTSITKEIPLTPETKALALDDFKAYFTDTSSRRKERIGLVTLEETWDENAKQKIVSQNLTMYAGGGVNKILQFPVKPDSRRGYGMLEIDRNIWSYNPVQRNFTLSIDRFVDLNPILTGDESKQELIGYFTGVCNGYDAHLFRILDKENSRTLEYWIEDSLGVMLLEDQFNKQGSLIDRFEYLSYTQLSTGEYYCTELRRWAYLSPSFVQYTRTTDIKEQTIPDDYFTKAYVEQVCR